MMKCQACGTENSWNASFCEQCGHSFNEHERIEAKCNRIAWLQKQLEELERKQADDMKALDMAIHLVRQKEEGMTGKNPNAKGGKL